MLAIRLPADIEKRLAALAKKTGRTKTHFAREAIVERMQDMEDFYLAERISDEINSGKQSTTSLKDMLKEHGLED